MGIEPSSEEKLDYIYERLKKQERKERLWMLFKWGSRIFIILSLLYLYYIKLPALKADIIESLKPDLPSISSESFSFSWSLDALKQYFNNKSSNTWESMNVDNYY